MTVPSPQAKSACGSTVNVRLPWQMVPFPTALQVKKDGGGGVSDSVTCCAAKLAGTGVRTPRTAVSSAVNRTRCRMRTMSLLPFLRRSRLRPSDRDLVVECGVWSFLRCFGGGLVWGEPARRGRRRECGGCGSRCLPLPGSLTSQEERVRAWRGPGSEPAGGFEREPAYRAAEQLLAFGAHGLALGGVQ